MTELTNAQLHQIREALKTSIELTPTYRTDNPARGELQAALDIVTKLLEVPAKVEAAPAAAKAKTVKLTPAQREMAHKIDYNGTLRVVFGTQAYRTMDAMRKKGLVEITEIDHPWGSYYGLTEAGYAALSNR